MYNLILFRKSCFCFTWFSETRSFIKFIWNPERVKKMFNIFSFKAWIIKKKQKKYFIFSWI